MSTPSTPPIGHRSLSHSQNVFNSEQIFVSPPQATATDSITPPSPENSSKTERTICSIIALPFKFLAKLFMRLFCCFSKEEKDTKDPVSSTHQGEDKTKAKTDLSHHSTEELSNKHPVSSTHQDEDKTKAKTDLFHHSTEELSNKHSVSSTHQDEELNGKMQEETNLPHGSKISKISDQKEFVIERHPSFKQLTGRPIYKTLSSNRLTRLNSQEIRALPGTWQSIASELPPANEDKTDTPSSTNSGKKGEESKKTGPEYSLEELEVIEDKPHELRSDGEQNQHKLSTSFSSKVEDSEDDESVKEEESESESALVSEIKNGLNKLFSFFS